MAFPNEMVAYCGLIARKFSLRRYLNGIFLLWMAGARSVRTTARKNPKCVFWTLYATFRITTLLGLNFFGEEIFATVNFPGSWHDSRLANSSGPVTKKLVDARTPPGYAVLGGRAFSPAQTRSGKIVRARKMEDGRNTAYSEFVASID